MTSAYRKAPPQVEIPVEELRVLPEHIFAKVGGFEVHFKKNGRAEASRSYSNIGVSLLQEQGGRTFEKKELAKEIEVKLTFGVASFPPDIYLMNERVRANFKLGEKKHSIEGMFFDTGDICWTEGEKGSAVLGERFINTLDKDIRSFHKNLDWALKFDKRLAPALAAEASSQEALQGFVFGLADEAEHLSERFDVKKDPLVLLPVFNKAMKRGVASDVITELGFRRTDSDNPGKQDTLIRILSDFSRRSRKELEDDMREK